MSGALRLAQAADATVRAESRMRRLPSSWSSARAGGTVSTGAGGSSAGAADPSGAGVSCTGGGASSPGREGSSATGGVSSTGDAGSSSTGVAGVSGWPGGPSTRPTSAVSSGTAGFGTLTTATAIPGGLVVVSVILLRVLRSQGCPRGMLKGTVRSVFRFGRLLEALVEHIEPAVTLEQGRRDPSIPTISQSYMATCSASAASAAATGPTTTSATAVLVSRPCAPRRIRPATARGRTARPRPGRRTATTPTTAASCSQCALYASPAYGFAALLAVGVQLLALLTPLTDQRRPSRRPRLRARRSPCPPRPPRSRPCAGLDLGTETSARVYPVCALRAKAEDAWSAPCWARRPGAGYLP